LVFVAVAFAPALPRISLDSWFADGVVRLTDTATWTLLTLIASAIVIVVITRKGLTRRRRSVEAAALAITMLVALAGNALLNEHVVKPFLDVPRPNIVALAEAGALGPEIPNAGSFYAVGDKDARRAVLRQLLPSMATPSLSDVVQAHWIHETGYSFPSGHTTAAMTFMVLLGAIGLRWLAGWRRVLTLWVVPVWAVLVAYSRTLLEVHTAADVVAGMMVGFAWGLLAAAVVLGAIGDPPAAAREAPPSSLAS
jgi:phosphatidylglycerophosphatase B